MVVEEYRGVTDYKYVASRDDVPVTGQGIGRNWTDDEIDRAVQTGEEKLEADVNEGTEIGNPKHLHAEAAATWATYDLVKGMKPPDAATRGDSLDEGTERMEFARQLRDDYFELVESISTSEGDEGRGTISFEVADW